MIKKTSITLLVLLTIVLLTTSCVSKKKYVYYQNIEEIVNSENITKPFETKLVSDDLLMILVSAEDSEAAIPFNLFSTIVSNPKNPAATGQASQQLYLIDSDGKIEFPVIGTLKISGLTKTETIDLIKNKINKYIRNPIVNIRIMNYKVTVQGEVNRPGIHTISSERLTLPEALALSGDLTTYGNRKNIMIIREENGKKTTTRVDLTKADFIDSPYYFLKQNDIVYVEPNKTRVNSSVVGPNISTAISALSVLITVLTFALRFK